MQRRTSTTLRLALVTSVALAACEPNLPAEDALIAASSYGDRLHVVDPGTGAAVAVIPVDPRPQARDGPSGLAVSPDGEAWYVVVGEDEPALWGFSGRSVAPSRTIPLPGLRHASRVAVSPDGGRAVVTEYLLGDPSGPGRAAVVDLASGTEEATLAPCPTPYAVAFSPSGERFALSCPLSDEIVVFGSGTLEVESRFTVTSEDVRKGVPGNPSSRPMGLGWSPAGDRLYVALFQERRLAVFTSEGAAIARYDLGGAPMNVRVRGGGRYVVAAVRDDPALAVLDVGSRRVSKMPLPGVTAPHDLALSPDGRIAYVAHAGGPAEPGGVAAVDLDAGTLLWNAGTGPMTTSVAYRPAPPSSVDEGG